jgi:hypothetical protein
MMTQAAQAYDQEAVKQKGLEAITNFEMSEYEEFLGTPHNSYPAIIFILYNLNESQSFVPYSVRFTYTGFHHNYSICAILYTAVWGNLAFYCAGHHG